MAAIFCIKNKHYAMGDIDQYLNSQYALPVDRYLAGMEGFHRQPGEKSENGIKDPDHLPTEKVSFFRQAGVKTPLLSGFIS
jgi:hypothetical protein